MSELHLQPVNGPNHNFPALFGSIAVGFAIILFFGYRWALPKPIPGIPYNEAAARSLFGDVPAMLEQLKKNGHFWPWIGDQLIKHQSPIIQVFGRPFSKPWVVIADYRESQDILIRRTKEFDRSNLMGDMFMGLMPDFHISKMSTDERFKNNRALLKDLMTPGFLHEVSAPQIYQNVDTFIKLWSEKLRLAKGHPFSAANDIFDEALDTIFAAAFGLDVEDSTTSVQLRNIASLKELPLDQNPDAPVDFPSNPRPAAFEAIVTLTESIEAVSNSATPRLSHWILRQRTHMKEARAQKEKMIANYVKEAVDRISAGEKGRRSALEHILQREHAAAQKEGRQPVYNSRAIYDEMFGFLIGGHDTTSTTLLWAMKNLAIYRESQSKLRSRMRAAYPEALAEHRSPNLNEIIKIPIPYLDAFIEEIARTAAIFDFIPRQTMTDAPIFGHVIPKGYEVFLWQIGPDYLSPPFSVPDSLRSESCLKADYQVGSWKPNEAEMNAFMPERWLVKNPDDDGREVFNPQAGPHLAFGLGPRGCFGRRLAYLQLRIIVALLIWNFELLETPPELSSFDFVHKMARAPKQCYVRLGKVEY